MVNDNEIRANRGFINALESKRSITGNLIQKTLLEASRSEQLIND